jgi:threonine/homoserine/homoserine lactone efflux protein
VVWLGIQAIRHRKDARAALVSGERRPERSGAAVWTGMVVGMSNPKTIVFFVAFLPQFTNPAAGHVGLQVALLGLLFGVLAVASDSAWAMAAGTARDWFARRPERLDTMGVAGGVMMIGLGATMAAAE